MMGRAGWVAGLGLVLALAAFSSFEAGPAVASGDARNELPDVSVMSVEELVTLRQQVMGLNVRALSTAAQQTGEDAVKAGDDLMYNARFLKVLFPVSTRGASASASPAIWDNWDEFIGYLDDLDAAGTGMKAAATQGDMPAYLAAVQQAGASCAACHQAFRR